MDGIEFNMVADGLGILEIRRPHVRNALDWSAMTAFRAAVEEAHSQDELSVLIVTGDRKAFISGGDLSVLQHYPTREDGLQLASIMGDALIRLEALECITIAAVNGPARGGGAEVAIACDLRVFSTEADIGFVHSLLGIIPAWGGGQRLMQLVGYAKALELIATGRAIDAVEAMQLRIANLVTGDALTAARDLAMSISQRPKNTTQAIKRFLRFGQYHDRDQALAAERAEFPNLWDSDYLRSSIQRFLGKKRRAPGTAG